MNNLQEISSLTNPPIPFITLIAIITTLITCCPVEGIIGINWGRQTTHRLVPSMVVDLLLQNNISHVKLSSSSDNVLKAFASSNISVTVTLPNESIKNIKIPNMARYFLEEKVRKYQNQNVKIISLYVGSEPLSTYYRPETYQTAPIALRLIQDAIPANDYGNLIATIPHFTDVLIQSTTKPSEADFRPEIKDSMVEIVSLLNKTNAPFVMHMFPIYSVINHTDWDPEFSFIDNKSNFTIKDDNGLVYHNVFEFVYDSFLHAIAKAGSPGLELTVGKIGWPTDGFSGANIPNAERFFREFLPYIKSNKGTPLRPGISIDVFIHNLADENKNRVDVSAFQRHWGIYWTNGQPKYKIDFTGQGRDIYPTTAKGLILMPKRWCIFNNRMDNLTLVKFWVNHTCTLADCTTLAPGGSCSHLDYQMNVSYAFNQFFQVNAQSNEEGKTCDFDGLGVLVPNDPSTGTCKFPVEIIAAENPDKHGLNEGIRYDISGFTCGLAMLLFFLLGLV
ncbi:hypothetical protein CASFOL_021275 [Castilleja foliolosa]|uniref:X8 domain-containing protein n=1 Tax=Castilleja foliolosa TaxID=1961234 RepID=A0ABD3CW39_9LAMI